MAADLYDQLGVPRGATADEIKRAYRRAARDHHPDLGGDEEQFKAVTHAYEVLSDPQRRARYDRTGDDGTPQTRGQSDPFGGMGGLGDVFDAFFGQAFGGGPAGGGRARRDPRGRDVLRPTALTLEDVAVGVQQTIEVDVAVSCDDCAGIGTTTSGGASTCLECGGRGQVQRIVRTAFGQLASATTCPRCEGDGVTIADPCPTCRGHGRHGGRRKVTVNIPAGVNEGDRLRVSGSGEAGLRGAPAGDLFVEVRVTPHDVFERDGRDLWTQATIPLSQAALGTVAHLDNLDGSTVEVTIPAGTQPGDVVSVRRAGLPRTGGGARGDVHVTVRVEVPSGLDDVERDLLRQLAEHRGEDVPADGKSLFGRLRDAFR